MADKKDNSAVNIPDFIKNIPSRKLEDILNPRFVLGDTPEQLNIKCANWVDIVVVDGKAYTTQDVENLLVERNAFKVDNKALANAVLTALYGTLLDEHGNRDENGILRWGTVEDAINALTGVAAIARKAGE